MAILGLFPKLKPRIIPWLAFLWWQQEVGVGPSNFGMDQALNST
jgi:hypothetical protein